MRTGLLGVVSGTQIGRFLGLIALLAFGSVTPAIAESYQCTFKPRNIERNLFPTSLRIDWPDYLKPAHITGTIANANGLKDVLAHEPIEAGKRITFSWELPQIDLPQFFRLFTIERSKADIRYMLVLFPASGKATLKASQFNSNTFSEIVIRTVGRCKVIK